MDEPEKKQTDGRVDDILNEFTGKVSTPATAKGKISAAKDEEINAILQETMCTTTTTATHSAIASRPKTSARATAPNDSKQEPKPDVKAILTQGWTKAKQTAADVAKKLRQKMTTRTKKSAEPPAPKEKVSFKQWAWRTVNDIVPKLGDSKKEIIRKCAFMMAVIVLLSSACYLFNDMFLQPIQAETEADQVRNLYTPGKTPVLSDAEKNFDYPEGILPEFKKLYYLNSDMRGWLTFKSSGKTDIFDNYINYPVLQYTDNDYYLTHNFQKTESKNGALFFDYRNNILPETEDKNLIIYGHNLSSGQMFTRLNKLITFNKSYARATPTITASTLFEKSMYKVFAVMVINTKESDGKVFKYWRTAFKDDDDFLDFVSNIRARSLYDYNDVDVQAEDQLLMLSTCNAKGQAHFNEGRTVVVARKVRAGESAAVDVSLTEMNDNVLMPQAWYKNQKKAVPDYYKTGVLPEG